jgi:hypothetical protein
VSDYEVAVKLIGEDNLSGILESVSDRVKTLVTGFVELLPQITAATAALGALAVIGKETLEAAAASEKFAFQLASLTAATQGWDEAMKTGAATLRMLDQVSGKTGESTENLVSTYRQLGALAGGTSTQIVGLTQSLAVVAAQAGTSSTKLTEVITRAAMTGQLLLSSPGARELAEKYQITGPVLQSWQQAGTLMQDLTERLKDTTGAAGILERMWGTLTKAQKTARDALLSDIGEAWEPLKAILIEIRDLMLSEGFRGAIRDAANAVAQFLDAWRSSIADSTLLNVAKGLGTITEALNLATGPLKIVLTAWVGLLGAMSEIQNAVTTLYTVMTGGLANAMDNAAKGADRAAEIATQTAARIKSIWAGAAPGSAASSEAAGPFDDKEVRKLQAAFDKLFESLDREHSLAGLQGIQKQLMQNRLHAEEEIQKVTQTEFTEAGKRVVSEQQVADAKALIWSTQRANDLRDLTTYGEKWSKEFVDATTKAYNNAQKATAQYNVDLAKLRSKSSTDELDLIHDTAEKEIAEAERITEKLREQSRTRGTFAQDEADIAEALIAKTAEIRRREEADEKMVLDRRSGNWEGYFQDIIDKATEAGENSVAVVQAALNTVANRAIASANTMRDGVIAAWWKIKSTIQTDGQIVAQFAVAAWDTIGKGFSDSVYAVITGKASSLLDILKGVFNSILREFSDMVAKMVQKWIVGQLQMGETQGPLQPGTSFGGGGSFGLPDYVLPSVAAGMAGYGATGNPWIGLAGAAGGIIAGATGLTTALATGILSGLSVTVIGAIIAVVVMAIAAGISALLKKSTQQWQTLAGTEILGPGQTQAGAELFQKYGKTLGSFSDIMRAGGGKGSDLVSFLRANQDEFLRSTGIKYGTGSNEDTQKLWDEYLKNFFPKTMLSMAFGRQATGGFASIPGVGENFQGIPEFTGGAGDTPLTRMMKNLGFTAAKLDEIAKQIDTRDADEFIAWLTKMVTVVKGFNDLTTDFRKSSTDIFKEFDKVAGTPASVGFSEGAGNLIDLASSLSLFAGDEQLNRAQDLLQLGQQYYQSQVQYLKSLYDLQKSITGSVDTQIRSMSLDMMDPKQKTAFYRSDMTQTLAKLRLATTPEEIKLLFNQISGDVSSIWQGSTKSQTLFDELKLILTEAGNISNAALDAEAAKTVARNTELADAMDRVKGLFTGLSDPLASLSVATDSSTIAVRANEAAIRASTAVVINFTAALDDARAAVAASRAGTPAAAALAASAIAASIRQNPSVFQSRFA